MKKNIQEYIEWKAGYAPKASKVYALHIQRFDRFVGHKKIENIRLSEIVKFQEYIRPKFSAANTAYTMCVIKNFFNFWSKRGLDVINPFLIKIPKFIPKERSVVDQQDYKAMIETTSELNFEEMGKKLALILLWETGIRVSELCDLNVSNIHTDCRYSMIVTKKNRKFRWIMWSKDAHSFLIEYLGIRLCKSQEESLFISRENKRPSTRSIQRWIKDLAKRASINKRISPHSFRHGKAHYMLSRGANVKEIQQVLGHSENNPMASFNYIKLDKTEFVNMADRYLCG